MKDFFGRVSGSFRLDQFSFRFSRTSPVTPLGRLSVCDGLVCSNDPLAGVRKKGQISQAKPTFARLYLPKGLLGNSQNAQKTCGLPHCSLSFRWSSTPLQGLNRKILVHKLIRSLFGAFLVVTGALLLVTRSY